MPKLKDIKKIQERALTRRIKNGPTLLKYSRSLFELPCLSSGSTPQDS
jgi:hypothetical protein